MIDLTRRAPRVASDRRISTSAWRLRSCVHRSQARICNPPSTNQATKGTESTINLASIEEDRQPRCHRIPPVGPGRCEAAPHLSDAPFNSDHSSGAGSEPTHTRMITIACMVTLVSALSVASGISRDHQSLFVVAGRRRRNILKLNNIFARSARRSYFAE